MFFCFNNGKFKMATITEHSLINDLVVKCLKENFSETTNLTAPELYKNSHWLFLYNLYVFVTIRNLRWLPGRDIV